MKTALTKDDKDGYLYNETSDYGLLMDCKGKIENLGEFKDLSDPSEEAMSLDDTTRLDRSSTLHSTLVLEHLVESERIGLDDW